MEKFPLKQYSGSDIEKLQLCELLKKSDSQDIWQFDKIIVTLGQKNSSLFFAEEGDESGWCGFILTQGLFDPCDILLVYVDSRYRSQGLGNRLLNFAMAELSDRFSEFILEVSANNEPAIGLYEKFGFKPIDVRKSYYKDGSDAVIYRKTRTDDR